MISFKAILESMSSKPTMDALALINGDPNQGTVYAFVCGPAGYQVRVDPIRFAGETRFQIDFGRMSDDFSRPGLTKADFVADYSHTKLLRFSLTDLRMPFAVMAGVLHGVQESLKLMKAPIGSKIAFKGNTAEKQRVYKTIAAKFVARGLIEPFTSEFGIEMYKLVKLS